MKKIIRIILIILILILLAFLYLIFLYKVDNKEYAWYGDNKYIGHAFYGIDGLSYVNSSEALECGYDKGIRVMETDLIYTSDKRIVINHDWNNTGILTYKKFMNNKLYNKYSPMDLEMLISYMVKYDDLYIVIDTKEENYSGNNYVNIYKELVDYCKKIDVKLLDRIIIQIYDYDMYDRIDKIHNFDNYIFSLYKLDDFNLYKLIYFCLYNKIDVIVIPEWLIENNSINRIHINKIKSKNLKLYVHTVNDRDKYKEYLDMGIDGVYTDFLY